jgi:hypothetical protein
VAPLSVVAPDGRRLWAVAGIMLAFAVATYTTIAFLDPGESGRPGSSGAPGYRAQGPQQSPWKISVHGSAAHGRITKLQKARLERQEPRLRSVVRRIYDAVLIHPNRLRETLQANFTPAAGVALRRADVAASRPKVAATSVRRATIGVDVNGLKAAVASVVVRAAAPGAVRPVVHRSTLWLERGDRGWRVLAFEVDQAPLPERRPGKGAEPADRPGRRSKNKAGRADRPSDKGDRAGSHKGRRDPERKSRRGP